MVIAGTIANIPSSDTSLSKKAVSCCCGLCVVAFGILDALLTYILLVKFFG